MPYWLSRHIRKEAALASADLGGAFLCVMAALHIRFGWDVPYPHALSILLFLPLLLPMRLLAALQAGLYDFRRRLTFMDHLFGAAGAALMAGALSYLFLTFIQLYYLRELRLSRWVCVLDATLLFAWFAGTRAMMLGMLRGMGWRVRITVAGPESQTTPLLEDIRKHGPSLAEPTSAASADTLRESRPHLVILATNDLPQAELRDYLASAGEAGAEVYLHPPLNLAALANMRLTSVAGLPLAPVATSGPAALTRGVKRALDIGFAAVGLFFAAPFLAAAALAMRLASPGPIFYIQERVGRGGGRFKMIKLRTMHPLAEHMTGPALAVRDDPRIPPVGRVLRRFRLDEVPQLWNVLRGDMSLVGPRPERPEFTERYIRENPLYERRFAVHPGLTGLAQIHGRYDSDYEQKLRYDLIYANALSITLDLRILLSTVRTVLTGHGAI